MSAARTSLIELVIIARNLTASGEAWCSRFTVDELIQIGRAQLASGTLYPPHTWEPRQLREALSGIPPRWSESYAPVYLDAAGAVRAADASTGGVS